MLPDDRLTWPAYLYFQLFYHSFICVLLPLLFATIRHFLKINSDELLVIK